jgi:hypothetical protein
MRRVIDFLIRATVEGFIALTIFLTLAGLIARYFGL